MDRLSIQTHRSRDMLFMSQLTWLGRRLWASEIDRAMLAGSESGCVDD